METQPLFPLEYQGRIIHCATAEDRKALQEAILIAEVPADARNFTQDQLAQMSDACQRYDVPELDRVIKEGHRR